MALAIDSFLGPCPLQGVPVDEPARSFRCSAQASPLGASRGWEQLLTDTKKTKKGSIPWAEEGISSKGDRIDSARRGQGPLPP